MTAIKHPPGMTLGQKSTQARTAHALVGRNPHNIVALARKYSTQALVSIKNIMLDEANPVAVRLRAAEVLIERGYGKAPQAILLQDNSGPNAVGLQALTVLQKIEALTHAKEDPGAQPLELEAASVTEITEEEDPIG